MRSKSYLFIVLLFMVFASTYYAQAISHLSPQKWVGVWVESDSGNNITITKNSNSTLHAVGEASFCCAQISGEQGSDNAADYETHYGSFVFDAKPKAGHLITRDDPRVGCDVDIAKKDETLIIDEHFCGGANVSFNGTYTRKKP